MKPATFKYVPAQSPEDAIEHLARYEGTARLLAGGQSLIPLMNLRIAKPTALIDLACCPDLSYIRREDGWLAIGPMTTQSEVEHSQLVKDCCPLVAATMRYLGSPTIRNRGTIGGTLAHADRVAELPGVAVAAGAELVAHGPGGRRTVRAEEFFIGDLATSLHPDEILREVRFPLASRHDRSAFVEARNRHHDLATVGIAVSSTVEDGSIHALRIAAVGVGPRPVRLHAAENSLIGVRPAEKSIAEASALALDDVAPEGDFHASAEFRSRVVRGLVQRALQQAHGLKSVAP